LARAARAAFFLSFHVQSVFNPSLFAERHRAARGSSEPSCNVTAAKVLLMVEMRPGRKS
jgi:hypothetical protein